MKKNSVFLILISLIIGYVIGFTSFPIIDKYTFKEKYTNTIGYISVEKGTQIDSMKNYKGKQIQGFFHSAAPYIFAGSKYRFKKFIIENYNSDKFKDNGYLNFRFYISDQGEVIRYLKNEYDYDFNQSKLNNEMVNEIMSLTFDSDNWYPFKGKDTLYYMHLTYRIENGKITEIIP